MTAKLAKGKKRTPAPTETAAENGLSELREFIERVSKENPDEKDVERLQLMLKEKDNPLVKANDPVRCAFNTVIRAYAPDNKAMQEILNQAIRDKRKEMNYEHEGYIVRALIDQVILTEMRLAHLEAHHAARLAGNHELAIGIYYDKRLNAAQKRFLRATEALAKVRKITAETDVREKQAKAAGRRSTLDSVKLLNTLTGN